MHDYVLESLANQVGGAICKEYKESDIAVVFGVYKPGVRQSLFRGSVIAQQRIARKKTMVIDSGYVKRGNEIDSYYSIALEDINGFGVRYNWNSPPDRWDALGVELMPFVDKPQILLCGQVPWDASVRRIDYIDWLYKTAHELPQDRTVFRPHPLAQFPESLPGLRTSTERDIEKDIEEFGIVAAYNSNALVDAVINGRKALALGTGHMVSEVSVASPDEPHPKEATRQQWAYDLAYAQWRPDEMGEAFEGLVRG